jgi:AraC family L-rhamnose operon regulatory protein RhaS
MAKKPAEFIDGNRIYHADSCDPLVEAADNKELKLSAVGRRTYPGLKLPDDRLVELCSLGYWDATKDQSWGLPWHRNEGIEITLVDCGRVNFEVGQQNFQLTPNSVTITRPWQMHKVGSPNVTACRLHWIILDVGVRQPHTPWQWPEWMVLAPDDLTLLTDILRGNEQPVWKASSGICNCFENLKGIVDKFRNS